MAELPIENPHKYGVDNYDDAISDFVDILSGREPSGSSYSRPRVEPQADGAVDDSFWAAVRNNRNKYGR